MTTLILLPGNSAGNKQSTEEIQKIIGGNILYYTHWETGDQFIDFHHETAKLVALANGKPVSIVAKSAGTILAMKAAREAGLHIEKAVFLGTTVNWGIERSIPMHTWLKEWKIPTLFIQNENDPAISATDLATMLSDQQELLVLPGNSHNYSDLNQFIPHVRKILK